MIRGQSQKRMARWPKTNNGDGELYWKSTALNVVLREACVFLRDAPKSPRLRLWPVGRDDSSRVLIGAAGRSRSDWRRRTVGALIGQSVCRLLACACEQQSIARAQGLAAACKAVTTGAFTSQDGLFLKHKMSPLFLV